MSVFTILQELLKIMYMLWESNVYLASTCNQKVSSESRALVSNTI